jgi:hypothetical protein
MMWFAASAAGIPVSRAASESKTNYIDITLGTDHSEHTKSTSKRARPSDGSRKTRLAVSCSAIEVSPDMLKIVCIV